IMRAAPAQAAPTPSPKPEPSRPGTARISATRIQESAPAQPGPPALPLALTVSRDGAEIALTWRPAAGGLALSRYEVYRSTIGGQEGRLLAVLYDPVATG